MHNARGRADIVDDVPNTNTNCRGVTMMILRRLKLFFGFVQCTSPKMFFLNSIVEKTCLPKLAFTACCLCLPLQSALACTPLNKPLGMSICVDGTPWELRKAEGDTHTFYNTPEDFAASVIFYDGGTNDGWDSERAARIISNSDREKTDDFAVLKIGRLPSGNVVYAARVSRDGISYIHVTTVSVGPTKTMRVSTWRKGDTMSDRDRKIHMSFGKLLKSEQ